MNKSIALKKLPLVSTLVSFRRAIIRLRIVIPYFAPGMFNAYRWIWKRTELSNFYYDLTTRNMQYLAQGLATIFKVPVNDVKRYFSELDSDLDLRAHLLNGLAKLGVGEESECKYGKRYIWYAIVRIKKPSMVVETGMEHGMGTCILATALLRNKKEGFDGIVVGVDINPSAGKLISGKYKDVTLLLYDDSVKSLLGLNTVIDLMINDSDHDYEHEMLEYEAIKNLISERSVILSDNAHNCSALSDFSLSNTREFVFFSEQPSNHWYPGGGIGISFENSTKLT